MKWTSNTVDQEENERGRRKKNDCSWHLTERRRKSSRETKSNTNPRIVSESTHRLKGLAIRSKRAREVRRNGIPKWTLKRHEFNNAGPGRKESMDRCRHFPTPCFFISTLPPLVVFVFVVINLQTQTSPSFGYITLYPHDRKSKENQDTRLKDQIQRRTK